MGSKLHRRDKNIATPRSELVFVTNSTYLACVKGFKKSSWMDKGILLSKEYKATELQNVRNMVDISV